MDRKALNVETAYYSDTPKGKVKVFGPVCPDKIENLSMDGSLNCFRSPDKQKKSLMEIASLKDGYVFIALLNNTIVGYITFHPPEPFERWGAGGIDSILELGAIEVARGYRGFGIAHLLLKTAFCRDRMEDYIVLATEYYWHWDLEGSGLPVWEYRTKLERLMASAGLLPKETSDPEINSHPANALMVRFGKRVKAADIEAFEKLRLL